MKSIIKENLKDKEINKFSVLTYNVYCGPPILPTKHAGCLDKSQRQIDQIKLIKDLNPDIICLQEVLSNVVRDDFRKAFKYNYEISYQQDPSIYRKILRLIKYVPLIHILQTIILLASFYDILQIIFLMVAYWYITFTSGWIYFFGDTHPHGLVIFYKSQKFQEVRPSLAEQFDEQNGDLMNFHRPRGILWQCLRVRDNNQLLWVGNVHADSMAKDHGFEFRNPAATKSSHRQRQLNQCFKSAQAKSNDQNINVIIAGDFNTTKDLGELEVSEKYQFMDSWEAVNKNIPCISWDGQNNILCRDGFQTKGASQLRCTFDYIFYNKSCLIPTQSRIELKGVGKNSILSDHYGIFSELAFKNLVVKDYTSPSLIGQKQQNSVNFKLVTILFNYIEKVYNCILKQKLFLQKLVDKWYQVQ